MSYNAGSRLVTSVEGAVVSTYTFDANGNQTAVNAGGSRTTYAYDYENRMRTAIDPGGARSTMAYWADGMRRFLEVGGTRTTFVWDGSDYLQSRTPSEVTTFSTVDAQILDSETGGSESILVPDPLGSVVKVLDASGNQLYDAWYWAYGETRLSVGINNTPWGYGGTWGYHFDMSRRLYIRARVLDPVTGRWYSVDPLWPTEFAYTYVKNMPNSLIDFSGRSPCQKQTPCSKLGTSAFALCVSALCSMDSAYSFVSGIAGAASWGDNIVKGIVSEFKGAGKRGIGNPLDGSPDGCCKEAGSGKKDGAIPSLIAQFIRKACQKKPNQLTCAATSKSEDDCAACCVDRGYKEFTVFHYRCKDICTAGLNLASSSYRVGV